MPLAKVRGANINYEVIGTQGEWIALAPGGRFGLEHMRSVAQLLAKSGYRVLIHDRRNCGASDVLLEGSEPEHEIWAADLHQLLSQLGALPAYIGGRSSGCRLSLIFALRYPQAVRVLLLWRITGGPYAAKQLAYKYYGEYIDAARQGGMAAVCATEHFAECIAARPANHDLLMKVDPARFIAAMTHWSSYFSADANKPVIGASDAELRSGRMEEEVPHDLHRDRARCDTLKEKDAKRKISRPTPIVVDISQAGARKTANGRFYSNFASDALTTLATRACSTLMYAENSSGVLPTGVTASSVRRSNMSGDFIAATISRLSRSMMGRAVPAGATMPYHDPAS